MSAEGKRWQAFGLRPTARPQRERLCSGVVSSSMQISARHHASRRNRSRQFQRPVDAKMPAKTPEPLSYTTPPFAAVSGVVEYMYDTSQMTTTTPSPEPGPGKPSLKGPFWAMFAVGLLFAIMAGMSVGWWRKHKARLASDYYNELRPVSNYQQWRERQATKLLRSTETLSTSESRRDSESQQCVSLVPGGPSSSSSASGRE